MEEAKSLDEEEDFVIGEVKILNEDEEKKSFDDDFPEFGFTHRNDTLILCVGETRYDLRALIKEHKEMKSKLDEVYYAPGMPGYVESKADFQFELTGEVFTYGVDEPGTMISENRELRGRLMNLERKFEELYNAPGMPGYEKAKCSFESNVKK